MTPLETQVWTIFALPVIAFLIIALGLRPVAAGAKVAAGLSLLAIVGAFALSLGVFGAIVAAPGHVVPAANVPWLHIGEMEITIGLTLDSLTALMLVVVTSVSMLVQIYSFGYMEGDRGFARYYAYLSLFTAAMLGLVISNNLVMMYAFWELVGLASFLLIGFWYQKPSAAAAAKKAFITTRFGDVGFLFAILIAGGVAGTFLFSELFELDTIHRLEAVGFLGVSALTWVTLGAFAGAMGKSAQFPLHVWLPDAMEGPTPVSALIHAATMVAAGVYLVARLFPMFHHSPEAMTTVAVIGGFTAIFAASMGLVANDIKRVMAYSTVSQLGYMMLGLGVGAFPAAIFHLFNHAFFKALLFLGSGSVNHTSGTFDMRYMGGLRGPMKITYWCLMIASLSLAGIPPFSGFWSKDEILADALEASPVLFLIGTLAAFMTAFYVFRAMFMTFHGSYRGGLEAEIAETGIVPVPNYAPDDAHGHDGHDSHSPAAAAHDAHAAAGAGHDSKAHLHDSPMVMLLPMMILAVPSVISWLINAPFGLALPAHWLSGFLFNETYQHALGEHHATAFNPLVAGSSVLVALLGVTLAYTLYGQGQLSPGRNNALVRAGHRILETKWGFDIFYERVIVGSLLYALVCSFLAAFDRYVVDGVVNGVGEGARGLGSGLRLLETGQLQSYGLAIFAGVVVIMAVFLSRGA
ncbi:MAG: NADH-quinone oxidoreductase subunit L [Chloroflexi bacterium]|nr:NADH-quinone oxidoreductase subunit L [Chloroflexota bacterium]